jgi:DNA helicase-2/ATP-dependent DNA helicase PcrA
VGLRKGQKELVERYRGGKCAIPAIPGGGKTHCLSLWAVEMIANGYHKPGKILIVTYMNSAVNNFKQRISAELQKRGINGSKDYFVSTIHGLCLQIIKEKPDLIIANEEFEILDEVSKIHLISSAIDEWKRYNHREFRLYLDMENLSSSKIGDVYKSWHEKLCRIMLSAIGDFKVKGITPSEAKNKCKSLGRDSILSWASDIYEIYDRRLKMGGYLDFDDMLYNAKKMLQTDEHLLEKYRKKYSFVCEDEAQDSNYIQNEILTLIANGNLLRVGDSNQAICGSFSSSDFTLFKSFCDAPDTTVYSITQSSRNTRDIIDLANYFVKYVRENHPVHECRDSLLPQYIEPVPKDDPRPNPVIDEYGIKAAVFESWEEEAGGVVDQAVQMIKKHPDKTIAILVPTAWKMSLIIDILQSRKAPFEQLDNTSGERNKTLKKLGRIIDFLAVPEDGEKFSNMINECILTGEYDSTVFTELVDETETVGQRELLSEFIKKYPVEKILYPMGGIIEISDVPKELLQTKIWKDFTDSLDIVRELLEFPNTVVEKLILFISEKLRFDREERAIAQKVAGDVRYLMNQNPRWRLSDLAFELLSPKNMFNYFAGIVWDLKGFEPHPGVVTVATYHKSKGLEWDIVFLTGLNNADFPVLLEDKFMGEFWFLKEQYKNPQALIKNDMAKLFEGKTVVDSVLESKFEIISEKARLLYVGITRAKEYLFLSSYEQNKGKRGELPSRYFLELRRYIEEAGKV